MDKFREASQEGWVSNSNRIMIELQFKPDFDLKKGMTEAVAGYEAEGLLWNLVFKNFPNRLVEKKFLKIIHLKLIQDNDYVTVGQMLLEHANKLDDTGKFPIRRKLLKWIQEVANKNEPMQDWISN